jgi:hypothetical protein
MKILFALFLLLHFRSAGAQQPPSLETLLPRLYAYAQNYRATLPSLTCDESIASQVVKNAKVSKEMKIESTLTEVRDRSEPDPFTEHHAFKTVDGKPVKPHFKVPYLMQGGFANGVGFGRPTTQGCFDYHLDSLDGGATLRLEADLKPGTSDPQCNESPDGARKTVLVDAATGRITHVERTISAKASKQGNEAYFYSIDYGPQKLGDETFWLPVKMISHDPGDAGRMIVTYSNFHRFTGEIKVLPGSDPNPRNP